MTASFLRLKNRLVARFLSFSPSLSDRWAKSFRAVGQDSPVPWTKLRRPVSEARLALVTTAGLHLSSQAGFDMVNPAGDASFRVIPGSTPGRDLLITHDYYDHRDAEQDPNIVFPMDRLEELVAAGEVGSAAPRHISFMGHVLPPELATLVEETAPKAANLLKDDAVDCVLLTPA